MLQNKIVNYIRDVRQKGLYRHRAVSSNASAGYLHFSSNDYLSLSRDHVLNSVYQRAYDDYPLGSGGSTVVCGYHPIHYEVEKAFADALNVDQCLLFSSGFLANVSLVRLLAQCEASLLIDKAMHASVYDGVFATQITYHRYQHNDVHDAAKKAARLGPHGVLLTESIFSMSGQQAPLDAINRMVMFHQHDLLVDEAHAFGVLGKEGLGGVIHYGLTQKEVPLRVIPLGKAFGACGAIVAGQGEWVDALLQAARPLIYSTALSPAFVAGFLPTLECLRAADERRAGLQARISYFRECIAQSSLLWRDSHTAIQQLQLGCPYRAQRYADVLRSCGIVCVPIRQPTVSKQETGLRIIINYHHTKEEIDRLFECVNAICND